MHLYFALINTERHIVNINIETISDTRKSCTATFSAQELEQLEKECIQQFSKEIRIPGFRPGKAPANLIRVQFKQGLEEELSNKLASQVYKEVTDELKEAFIGVAKADVPVIDITKECTVVFHVDVAPSFELPNYRGIEITSGSHSATDEEVEKTIEELRKSRSQFITVERAANVGDYVKLAYKGSIDDKPVAEIVENLPPIFGTQTSTWEEAGATEGPHISAISEGIVGMKAGETKAVVMDFPKKFEVSGLAGKKVNYSVEVKEVKERKLPEVDEEFLKSFKVSNLDELKQQTRSDIEDNKKQQDESNQRMQIVNKVLGQVNIPIPETLLERQTERSLSKMVNRLARHGISPDKIEADKHAYYEKAKVAATDDSRLLLVLGKIASAEKITLTNEDINHGLLSEAYESGISPDKLVKEIRNDRGILEEVKRRCLIVKTIDFIRKQANVVSESQNEKH